MVCQIRRNQGTCLSVRTKARLHATNLHGCLCRVTRSSTTHTERKLAVAGVRDPSKDGVHIRDNTWSNSDVCGCESARQSTISLALAAHAISASNNEKDMHNDGTVGPDGYA